jgi:hypothetical protein
LNVNADDGAMVNAALAAGLYPKLLVIDLSNGGLKTLTNNQAISVVSRNAVGSLGRAEVTKVDLARHLP